MSILDANKRSRTDAWDWSVAAGVVILAFVLYFVTAARDIVVGDAPELITAAATLGVPHPPGYPLFTMLGHLFSLLPFGPIPFRVNLLAVACDALAVGIVFLTAMRLTGNRIAANIAALILAVSPVFWSWSLVADVFALNNLLAALLIYFLLRWRQESERAGFLVAACFIGGLALTNHQTVILLAPACAFLAWQKRGVLWRRPQILAWCIVVFLLGLLPYAYVLWASARHPLYNWGNVSSFHDLLGLIARRSYGTRRLVSSGLHGFGSPVDRMVALCVSFGPLMGTLVVLGLIRTWQSLRWYFWFALVGFAGAGVFFVAIANLNLRTDPFALFVLERFFILSQVVLAPLMAFGLLLLASVIALLWPRLAAVSTRLIGAAAAIAMLIGAVAHFRGVDQSNNQVARNYAEDIFISLPPDSVLLVSGDETILPLTYLHIVEKKRPDVRLVLVPLLPGDWYLKQLGERYPDFTMPFSHYDGQTNNIRMLLEANRGRTIALIGLLPLNDISIEGSYWLSPHGLVNLIEPMSRDIVLQDAVRENERLLNVYRPPDYRAIKTKSFEKNILFFYAEPAVRIGNQLERTGAKEEARAWYERARKVAPDLSTAREALVRIR